jgi:hypothetical protein
MYLPDSVKPVRLIYQKGFLPRFEQGTNLGDTFSLNFGSNDFGDTIHELVGFVYRIRSAGNGYEVYCVTGDEIPDYLKNHALARRIYKEQKPKIDELIKNLNEALSQHKKFDFIEYIAMWEVFDEDFYIWVYSFKN